MRTSNQVTLFSPAKVNLGLSIVGRREADGFHLLSSLFWPLDFGDTITVTPSEQNSVRMAWAKDAPFQTETLPNPHENIVSKLLSQIETKLDRKFSIHIEKKIPMGGGLGGGSSNAGTLLKWFITRKEISIDAANQIGLALGADVPFFLNPQPSVVGGIGEEIRILSLNPKDAGRLRFVLILFPLHSNTRDVFRQFAQQGIPFSAGIADNTLSDTSLKFDELRTFLQSAKNDLEQIVVKTHPIIDEALKMLRSTKPLFAAMSGSGTACVAAYDAATPMELISKAFDTFCRKNGCRNITANSAAR